MVWRESFPPANELTLDAEVERERRLAAQARAGADWALTALIARYQPAVTRYLTRLCGNQGHARELAERVFQRMERRLHGPHGADNLRLWLLRASTEAGLEVLRRTQRGDPPRLGATQVAGLLPEGTGAEPQSALRDGISRLRNVVGAISRQARPLIWQATDTAPRPTADGLAQRARDALEPGPVDEALDTLDTLDPREVVRHRLVRVILAELPYGDAQCLALHLVAGLNQAEVARALGITGSAARKRIVQGLSRFSERYQTAVQSLGLPEELGYGDALPRRIEEEGPTGGPEPEPVIVPEAPGEIGAGMAESAPPTIPLAVDARDDDDAVASDTPYYSSASADEPPTYPGDSTESPGYVGGEVVEFDSLQMGFDQFDAGSMPGAGASGPPHVSSPHVAVIEDEQEITPGAMEAQEGEPDESGAPYAGAGIVTRIASDAIRGPVVDALPVNSEPLAMSPGFGSPGQRSTPLAYELASGDADTGGITMNWIDSAGMVAPLSFEAIVTPSPADAEGGVGDDPWARSMILELETPVDSEVATAPDAAEVNLLPADAAVEPLDASPPLDMSIALDEGDYGWERPHQDTAMPDSGAASPAHDMVSLGEQAPGMLLAEPPSDDAADHTETGPQPAPPVAQTLEDLWDEAPDTFGR